MAIIGLFSLVAGYGLLMKRNWSLYLVVILFFVATVFSLYMLYYMFMKDLIINLGSVAYLVLSWIATIYVATKRVKLEN
jgi:membrane protein YdbS with pleckstrin-like domain